MASKQFKQKCLSGKLRMLLAEIKENTGLLMKNIELISFSKEKIMFYYHSAEDNTTELYIYDRAKREVITI